MAGRIVWSKIAKVIQEEYVDGGRCKICNAPIEPAENRFRELSNIYKHFRENHPEIIDKVKAKLATE